MPGSYTMLKDIDVRLIEHLSTNIIQDYQRKYIIFNHSIVLFEFSNKTAVYSMFPEDDVMKGI